MNKQVIVILRDDYKKCIREISNYSDGKIVWILEEEIYPLAPFTIVAINNFKISNSKTIEYIKELIFEKIIIVTNSIESANEIRMFCESYYGVDLIFDSTVASYHKYNVKSPIPKSEDVEYKPNKIIDMNKREILQKLNEIVYPIHAHSDKLLAISEYIYSEFNKKQ